MRADAMPVLTWQAGFTPLACKYVIQDLEDTSCCDKQDTVLCKTPHLLKTTYCILALTRLDQHLHRQCPVQPAYLLKRNKDALQLVLCNADASVLHLQCSTAALHDEPDAVMGL